MDMQAENILSDVLLITSKDYFDRPMRPNAFRILLNYGLKHFLLTCLTGQRPVPDLNPGKFYEVFWFVKYTEVVHKSKRRKTLFFPFTRLEIILGNALEDLSRTFKSRLVLTTEKRRIHLLLIFFWVVCVHGGRVSTLFPSFCLMHCTSCQVV